MPQQVTFTNPADGQTYQWPINPGFDGVTQPATKQRQIDRTSNTGNVGATKQQGDDGSYVLHWEPLIFHAEHERQLFAWFQLCKSQTIYLTDWNGEQYEGQIITLARTRQGAGGGPGDTNSRGFYETYVFEFEVWRFISGMLKDSGVYA